MSERAALAIRSPSSARAAGPAKSQLKSSLPAPFLKALAKVVGRRFLLQADEERLVYESDACLLMKAIPDAVVLPNTTEQVADVVKLCRQHQVPFVARGAGTGLSGGALPVKGGIIIGLNRMNRLLEIDTQHHTALVEVGLVNVWLNRALAPYGLFYAPDPSSQSACTIGGNVAENAGGIHCVKYGVTSDHILSLEVVLPDGQIVWLGSHNRRSHGLNLVGLMVGSEGTLGIVTRVRVRLLPLPQYRHVFLAAFDTVAQATDTVSAIIAAGLVPAAMEFMDAFTIRAVNQAFGVGFPENSEAVLLIEVDGTEQEQVREATEQLRPILEQFQPSQIRVAETEADCATLWKARKSAVAAYGRILPAMYVHDCVIPRSRLTEVLTRMEAIRQEYDLIIGNVFHAGDGNLHPNIMFHPNDPDMIARVLKGGEAILQACLEVGGTLSGEHGIGIEKSEFMDRVYSPQDLEKMKSIKQVLDPLHLCNPDKIFPTPRCCGDSGHHGHGQIGTSQTQNPDTEQRTFGKPFEPSTQTDGEEGLWI
ncbi:MAG: FAD-linked oxidase C-terminal domain-containing protein [Candidatus Melainabacteria bacterium]|nr:FAD-linked oxidase C-terminal domain-containing protein [Candidatus Melainabacteria bacterium]